MAIVKTILKFSEGILPPGRQIKVNHHRSTSSGVTVVSVEVMYFCPGMLRPHWNKPEQKIIDGSVVALYLFVRVELLQR